MLIKKGMQVRIISGAHKGSEGKVLFSSPKKQRIIVEGVNFIKKSTRPSQDNPKGGIVEKEAALHVSNVMILQGGTASRLGYKLSDDGSKIRVLKKTNEESEIQ
jgi:large subunit ribosomal protein L24|tara:strand:+ start:498 stop:809 length:312 start_codon:yes stop_codon:yes gene_type:complete